MIKKLFIITCCTLLALCSCDKGGTNNLNIGPPPSGGDSGNNTGDNTGDNSGDNTGDKPGEETGMLCTDIGQTPMVLAYYTENSPNLPDVTLLTHINYAHGRFNDPTNGSGGIWIDKPELMQKVIALKSVNRKLKVMLMIGGWGMKADGFSMMARSAEKRTEFCHSVHSLIKQYNLDGVDIDWEYPTYSAEGTGRHDNDTQNFNLVLKELRDSIGTGKIISFASSASAKYVDWPTAIQYIDYVNVMTYDMGAAPKGHNSPLYRSTTFDHRSCHESVQLHVEAGVPKNRQVLGVPFYGKSDKSVYAYEVKYNEMDEILNQGTYKGNSVAGKNIRRWEATSLVPYLVDEGGNILLSYDDQESVSYKGKYAKAQGMLGVMFWEYRHDDDKQTLLKSLVKGVYGKESVLE